MEKWDKLSGTEAVLLEHLWAPPFTTLFQLLFLILSYFNNYTLKPVSSQMASFYGTEGVVYNLETYSVLKMLERGRSVYMARLNCFIYLAPYIFHMALQSELAGQLKLTY